jgi:hypothetical protein
MALQEKALEAGKEIARTTYKYFHWDHYFAHRIKSFLGGSRVHEITSEADFWRLADGLATPFVAGDQVELRCDREHGRWWHVTDWVPRMPGQLLRQPHVASPNDFARNELFEYLQPFLKSDHPKAVAMAANIPAYGWNDKLRLCLNGVGSVRLPTNSASEDNYACLSAVTTKGWMVDAGIPIVVSRGVYEKFMRAREQNNSVEADLRGWVVKSELPFDPTFGTAVVKPDEQIGAQLAEILKFSDTYIYVNSPQDCEFRTGRSHPFCNAWSMFRCTVPATNPRFDVRDMITGLGAFGLTYCQFDPSKADSFEEAVRFLAESPRWLKVDRDLRELAPAADKEWSSLNFKRLADAWGEVKVDLLTDFDGVRKPLSRPTVIEMGGATTPQGRGLIQDVLGGLADALRIFGSAAQPRKPE